MDVGNVERACGFCAAAENSPTDDNRRKAISSVILIETVMIMPSRASDGPHEPRLEARPSGPRPSAPFEC